MIKSGTELFVTAFYATLDIHTGWLTYANAGHSRPQSDDLTLVVVKRCPLATNTTRQGLLSVVYYW